MGYQKVDTVGMGVVSYIKTSTLVLIAYMTTIRLADVDKQHVFVNCNR